jgi:phage tail sheath protein FI
MPGSYTYPGIYVEEVPSGVRTIAGVSTSDTAFIDFFARGPVGRAVRVTSMDDFERRFGGLHRDSPASYAVAQYFNNGGSIAWIVRVVPDATAAQLVLEAGSPPGDSLTLDARDPGRWGLGLQAAVDYKALDPDTQFNLVVREVAPIGGKPTVVATEVLRNLSMTTTDPRYARAVVEAESQLVKVTDDGIGARPQITSDDVTAPDVITDPLDEAGAFLAFGERDDGTDVSDGGIPDSEALIDGLAALDRIAPHIFNLLCIPAAAELDDLDAMDDVIDKAADFCEAKRAFLIVDVPGTVDTTDELDDWIADHADALRRPNAAAYFPRVDMRDPLNEGRPLNVGASGTLAGVYARTDATRGVWKAPAGTDAQLRGARLAVELTDREQGGYNPLGINILRNFPLFGNIAWGARTLAGADQQASEWKYIAVRRTALYIEESLVQGLKWVVFEPNDEPLWAQIRLNVGAFMNNLFRQGAFQGDTPAKAYFVRCDGETTTQNDIDRGIVNILVGFAPLKPAEFVVIKLQQIAGAVET